MLPLFHLSAVKQSQCKMHLEKNQTTYYPIKPSVQMIRLISPFKVYSWAEEECGEELRVLLPEVTWNL